MVDFEHNEKSRLVYTILAAPPPNQKSCSVLTFFIVIVLVGLIIFGFWKYHIPKHTVPVYVLGAEDFQNDYTIEELQVETYQGKLQGKVLLSRNRRHYLAFLGIPYATPPLGKMRFQPPIVPEPWEGVRDATQFGDMCIVKQRSGSSKLVFQPDVTIGSEDCLYLNVFTPKIPSELNKRRNRFPVMIYVHGGAGGGFGSGQKYGADYFMDEDVVLVTLDYRLGVLGNLNTNTSLASGNQGLKDQLMGFQWVRDNIGAFGGDNKRVTLFGNSFGGIQISAHLLSPLGEGLYHRAITQSGSLLYPGFFTANPLHDARRLGKLLNCTTKSSENITNETDLLTNCFLKANSSDLVLQSLKFKNKFNYVFTISKDTASADTGSIFLPNGPLESLKMGKLKPIPFMTGIVDAEGLKDSLEVMIDPPTLKQFQQSFTQILTPTLYFEHTVQNQSRAIQISEAIQKFYLGTSEKRNSSTPILRQENFRNFTNIYTDRLYLHPAATIITFMSEKYNNVIPLQKLRNRKSPSNVYFYQFSHHVKSSRADPAQEEYDGGAEYFGECHADELQFFFPFEASSYIYPNDTYYNFSRMVVQLWVEFAKTGVPSGANSNSSWLPINDSHPYQYYNLDEVSEMQEAQLTGRIKFWNQFKLEELYM